MLSCIVFTSLAIFRPTKWLRKEYHGFKVITCVPEDEAEVEAVTSIRRLMDTGEGRPGASNTLAS